MEEPAQALSAVENALRLSIAAQLGTAWADALTHDKIDRIRERQRVESKRRDGVMALSDLVDFTDFTDLTAIVYKRWDAFKAVFDDKKRTEVYFGFIEDVRNSIAHSRPLARFEVELLSGMSTHIRNQVAMVRMAKNPVSSDYPLIESVRDSFGSEGHLNIFNRSYWPAVARLGVGDRVKYECAASDPRGRGLGWFLVKRQDAGSRPPATETAQIAGGAASVEFTVEEFDVGEELFVTVYLRHNGRYHLNPEKFGNYTSTEYDDVRHFKYAVRPPLDG